jgi:hypothetical protein
MHLTSHDFRNLLFLGALVVVALLYILNRLTGKSHNESKEQLQEFGDLIDDRLESFRKPKIKHIILFILVIVALMIWNSLPSWRG